jgi:DNA repair exonuclease SbcCD ATPase subunit
MHITTIGFGGIRGQTFRRFDGIGPVTVFTGPNGSGKTTIAEAVRLALTGQMSNGLSDNGMLLRRGSSTVVQSELLFSDGRTARFLLGKPDAAVSRTHESPKANPVVMNFGQFIAMSGPKRRAFLASLSGAAAKLTPDRIAEAILEEFRADGEGATAKGIEATVAALRAAYHELRDTPPVEAALVAGKELSSAASTAADAAERLRQASQGRTMAQATDAPKEQAPRPNVDALLKEANTSLGELKAKLRALRDQMAGNGARRLRRQQLETRARWPLAKADELQAVLADLEATSAALKAALAEADKHRGAFAETEAAVKRATAAKTQQAEHAGAMASALRMAEANTRTARAELVKLEQHAHCPFCKAQGEGWKANLEQSLRDTLTRCELAETRAREAAGEAEARMRDLVALEKEARELWEADRDKSAKAIREKDSLWAKERELNDRLARLKSAKMEAEVAAVQLSEFGEVPEDADLGNQIAETEGQVAELEKSIVSLSAESRRLVAARQDQLRQKQAEGLIAEAEGEAAAHKLGAKVITRLVKSIAGGGLDDFLAEASELTKAVFGFGLAMKGDVFGRLVDGKLVPVDELSGGELLVTLAALSTALASLDKESEFRVVLLDELGALAPDSRAALLPRLAEIAEARGIQFMLFDPQGGTVPEGVALIALG